MKAVITKYAAVLTGAVLLAGCAGIQDHRGYVVDTELASAIQVGVDNKESVAKTLGTPTFTGQFNDNEWYYLGRDTAQLAFRLPRVTDQTVLHIRFDQAGNVAAVQRSDESQIAAVRPNGDRTPTLGRDGGFFEELLNNIGTISQPGLPGSQPQ